MVFLQQSISRIVFFWKYFSRNGDNWPPKKLLSKIVTQKFWIFWTYVYSSVNFTNVANILQSNCQTFNITKLKKQKIKPSLRLVQITAVAPTKMWKNRDHGFWKKNVDKKNWSSRAKDHLNECNTSKE